MPSTSSYPLVQKQPFTDFFKTGVLKISQISQENTFVGVSLQQSCRPEGLQLYYREAATQVFSCEYCKIFKNNFFIEHLRWLLLLVFTSIDLQASTGSLTSTINVLLQFLTYTYFFISNRFKSN